MPDPYSSTLRFCYLYNDRSYTRTHFERMPFDTNHIIKPIVILHLFSIVAGQLILYISIRLSGRGDVSI